MTVRDVPPIAYAEQWVAEDAIRWTHCMEKSNGYPHAEPRGAEAYLRQYVEAARGEPARHTKLRLNRPGTRWPLQCNG
jgi:hypothetical protein